MSEGLNTELKKTVRIDVKTFITARCIFLEIFFNWCIFIELCYTPNMSSPHIFCHLPSFLFVFPSVPFTPPHPTPSFNSPMCMGWWTFLASLICL